MELILFVGLQASGKTSFRERWTFWRQDDNGQRFRISSGHARADAERVFADFEAKGHEQLYWISPDEQDRGAADRD